MWLYSGKTFFYKMYSYKLFVIIYYRSGYSVSGSTNIYGTGYGTFSGRIKNIINEISDVTPKMMTMAIDWFIKWRNKYLL